MNQWLGIQQPEEIVGSKVVKHDLSEDECLQFFSVTLLGIELILEERIATKEKNERIKRNTKDIALLTQKIKDQNA